MHDVAGLRQPPEQIAEEVVRPDGSALPKAAAVDSAVVSSPAELTPDVIDPDYSA
jgi:hypothetical protein